MEEQLKIILENICKLLQKNPYSYYTIFAVLKKMFIYFSEETNVTLTNTFAEECTGILTNFKSYVGDLFNLYQSATVEQRKNFYSSVCSSLVKIQSQDQLLAKQALKLYEGLCTIEIKPITVQTQEKTPIPRQDSLEEWLQKVREINIARARRRNESDGDAKRMNRAKSPEQAVSDSHCAQESFWTKQSAFRILKKAEYEALKRCSGGAEADADAADVEPPDTPELF